MDESGPELRVHDVTSIDDPQVAEYRSLRRVASLRRDGLFVAEGARVVSRLLSTQLRVVSLLVDPGWLETLRPRLTARPEATIDVFVSPKPQLERIVGFHVHQGVMAIAEAPQPPELVPYLRGHPDHILVALEGVSNAENVGGLLRSLAGFGGAGMIIDSATCEPFVRRAARVSMGAAFTIPVWRSTDLAATIAQLRLECGTRSLAAHLHGETEALDRAALGGPVLLALGSEATGLSDGVVAACDTAVEIPMDPTWDCLNVATAGAVILWEVARRRRSV